MTWLPFPEYEPELNTMYVCWDARLQGDRVYYWNGQNWKTVYKHRTQTKNVSHWLEVTPPDEAFIEVNYND
jgi:hypothetical protein